MKPPFILFDLDGTISDPLDGLSESINHALKHFGYPTRQRSELAAFVGPPLDLTFIALTGKTDKAHIRALVEKYREYYADTGFSKNVIYPGIQSALRHLQDAGLSMAVCTSKRKDFAGKIIDMFGLGAYFEFIDGGDIGISKWQQIERLREQNLVDDASIMVGDRAVDLVAAHRNGLRSAAVLWGYGSRTELTAENPQHIFSQPQELASQLSRNAKKHLLACKSGKAAFIA